MLGKLLLSKIGDIIDLIQELAPSALDLIKIYKQYSHPLSFVNFYRRQFPESSRQWAGMVYRAMRYFARQSDYLGLIPSDMEIDRRLPLRVPVPESNPLLAYQYRYSIDFTIAVPARGIQNTYTFWVNSPYLLTEHEVASNAASALANVVNRYSLTFNEGFENTANITATRLRSFALYDPEVRSGRNS